MRVVKFLIKYYYFCRQRQSDKSNIPFFRKKLGEILCNNYDLSVWLLHNATNESFIKENFVDCSSDDMKYLSSGILIDAVNTVSVKEQHFTYEMFVKKVAFFSFFFC